MTHIGYPYLCYTLGGMLEVWEWVEEEWNKIGAEVCQNLIESMCRRVAAVFKAKGGYTRDAEVQS